MKIRADLTRLQNEADRIDMKLLLDADRLKDLCCRGRQVNYVIIIFFSINFFLEIKI